jgi:putative heme iron utilization protein
MLFKLKPISGRFVLGFGQAFILTGNNLQSLQAIDAPRRPA